MAICATVDVSGVVHAAASVPLNECTGFVLLDQSDWIVNGLVQSLFTIPAGEDVQALWALGFIPPMTLGLVAWAAAMCIGVFKRD